MTERESHDIEAMASELARRRRRVLLLNLLILIVPIIAGIEFFLKGHDDRAWVREKVIETVAETVPLRVDKAVPSSVSKALEEAKIEQRLEALESRLNIPLGSGSPNITGQKPQNSNAGTIDALMSQELKSRLAEIDRKMDSLTKPEAKDGVPQLWIKAEDHTNRLDAQKKTLDGIQPQIDAITRQLTEERLNQRIQAIESYISNLPHDPRSINQRISSLEEQDLLDKINNTRISIDQLQKNVDDLDKAWKAALKEDRENSKKDFSKIDRRFGAVERSAFRSTLTRAQGEVTIASH